MIRKNFPELPINAISIKFSDGVDETKRAEKTARHFDAEPHNLYVSNYFEELPKAISIIKKPFWDIHWYYVAKKAKEFSKVIVSGDAGDELFGGYAFRYAKYLNLITNRSSPIEKVNAYLQCHERDWVSDQEKMFGIKSEFTWEQIYKQLLPYFDNKLPILNQVFLADYNGKLLYNWLPNNTRICKHFKLEPIIPLLSDKLIYFANHIQSNQKYNPQKSKGKICLQKILYKYKIDNLVFSKKQGFSVDTASMWKSYGKRICSYYLTNSRVCPSKIINHEWITKYLNKKDLDYRIVNKFYGILALEIWFRIFVTKEMSPLETITV